MKLAMPCHVQSMIRYPLSSEGEVASSLYARRPINFFFSSLAQAISHFSPLEVSVFLLTSAITPSERRILVRTCCFQSLSYGCLTDMSTNSNGVFAFTDCPLSRLRWLWSSIANATNTTFLSAMVDVPAA